MSLQKIFKPGVRFLVLSTVLLLTGAACNRSAQFQKDQTYGSEEAPSYYNRGSSSASPTQRVEQMGQPKKRVIVFDFWNDTPVKQNDLGPFAADELRRGLYQTQRLIVPADIQTELGTQDFVQGDSVKVAQLIREGRRLGVTVVVIGRVTKITFRTRGDEVGIFRQKQSLCAVDVEIKVFDVAAGREVAASGRSGESSANSMVAFEDKNISSPEFRAELARLAVRNAVVGLVPEVVKSVEKMTWQGSIAKIVGSKVYINAGKASGLVVGDILRVLTPGEDIHDPTSGAFLGRTQGQLKGTLEVLDFIGTDGAVTELHTGGNFSEGDLVRLY
jgi:hypothetical protein